MTYEDGIHIMQEALRSPHGVLLQVSNVEAAVAAFTRIAKQSLRTEFELLSFRQVQLQDGNLAIVKAEEAESGGMSANGLEGL